jgi:hypothetical protein
MDYQEAISLVESEWRDDDGFFWNIHQGQFIQTEFDRALYKISSITIPEDAIIPRRLVSLLWFIPLFMTWHETRVTEFGTDAATYKKASNAMTNEIERLLGFP